MNIKLCIPWFFSPYGKLQLLILFSYDSFLPLSPPPSTAPSLFFLSVSGPPPLPLFQVLHVWWPCCLIRSWRWPTLETHVEFFAIKTATPFLYRTIINLTSSKNARGSRKLVRKQLQSRPIDFSQLILSSTTQLEGTLKLRLLSWKHKKVFLWSKLSTLSLISHLVSLYGHQNPVTDNTICF